MAKVRSLFNGVSPETAIKKRKCHHNQKQHSIPANGKCLRIRNADGMGGKNYCPACAKEVLDKALDELTVIRAAFGLPT